MENTSDSFNWSETKRRVLERCRSFLGDRTGFSEAKTQVSLQGLFNKTGGQETLLPKAPSTGDLWSPRWAPEAPLHYRALRGFKIGFLPPGEFQCTPQKTPQKRERPFLNHVPHFPDLRAALAGVWGCWFRWGLTRSHLLFQTSLFCLVVPLVQLVVLCCFVVNFFSDYSSMWCCFGQDKSVYYFIVLALW